MRGNLMKVLVPEQHRGMPKASSRKTTAMAEGAPSLAESVDTAGSSFAEAQQALEQSLAELQRDDLPLEDLPRLYGDAMAWEERCRQILSEVSQQIQQLDPETLDLMPWTEAQP